MYEEPKVLQGKVLSLPLCSNIMLIIIIKQTTTTAIIMKNGSAGLLIFALHHFVAGIFAQEVYSIDSPPNGHFFRLWAGPSKHSKCHFYVYAFECVTDAGLYKNNFFLTKAFPTICPQNRFFCSFNGSVIIVWRKKEACEEWVRKQQTFVCLADDKSKHEN